MNERSGVAAAWLVAAIGANGLLAQDAPTLAELTAKVAAAHRTAEATPVHGFRADLRLEELARTAEEHRGQIELSVRFLDWQHPDTERPYPLIRYRQTDSARSVEQGRDREDYWAVVDGKPQDMRSREMATDLEHARRNLKLARQLLRFLEPNAVLTELKGPSAVTAGELVQGRANRTPCWIVEGLLPSFPLRQQSGEDAPVRAKLYVARADHRIVGLEVQATSEKTEEGPSAREFVSFAEHRTMQGRVVPTRLVHFAVDEKGKRNAQLGIDLVTLDLAAELTAADFDRPK